MLFFFFLLLPEVIRVARGPCSRRPLTCTQVCCSSLWRSPSHCHRLCARPAGCDDQLFRARWQMSQPFSPLKAWAEDKGDFHSLRGDQRALQMCTEALSTEYSFSSHAELHRSSVISGLHTEIPLLHSSPQLEQGTAVSGRRHQSLMTGN